MKGLKKRLKVRRNIKDLSKEQKEVMDLLIKEYKTPKKIAIRRKTSLSAVYKIIKKLEKKKMIKKIDMGVWEEIQPQKSLGLRADKPSTNLHALNIKIPILKGEIKETDWELKNKLNNWLPKYKKLDILGGLTIRNNNNRSISIFAKSRDLKALDEVDNLSFKIRAYMSEYMRQRGVVLDIFNAETKNLNLATHDKEAESMLRKGEKFELDLKKKAEKIFKKDKIDGKAWIDGSPFRFSAETNDKEWKRWYLGMPFMIRDMFMLQESMTEKLVFMAENQKSHALAIKELSKLAKNLNKKLSQTSLRKWL